MYIDDLDIPLFACGGMTVVSMVRVGAIILCEIKEYPIERITVEFESEEIAVAFESTLHTGHASIIIDEDTSIEAAPKRLRNKYYSCLSTGNKERLNDVLDELWEVYGINPNNEKQRRTSGVKRIAIMHDHGVAAYGFKGMKRLLRKWMREYGFPVNGWNLNVE